MAESPDLSCEISLERVSFYYPETQQLVFNDLSIELPKGVITLVGQNGTGKSTLLLLAAGILLPVEGTVHLRGIDTRNLREEQERQRHVSFVYQNMEFETEESIGDLLEYVHENGFHETKESDLITELIEICELNRVLGKKTQEVSKGELQRTIVAFSLLYGSKIVMMDEPIFALEEYQKHRIMAFLFDYSQRRDISLFYSVHELDISEKYSDYLLLFHKNGRVELGSTKQLFTRTNIEQAYEVPFVMLKRKEAIYREALRDRSASGSTDPS
ncbi:MAG: ABC transporter ATP-binding protein [Spirochaetaceae bacterium]|nr:MAG: ABC transporter ATP-binding protein [Spirochaetaceae bacterium]